jgi:F-type H+-transporting ATPase subunit delta
MRYVDPVLTERYARALFHAADRLGQLERLLVDIETLAPLLGSNTRLQVFLESPQVTSQAKHTLIDRAIGPHVSPLTVRLLHLLLAKGRIGCAEAIFRRVHKLVREAGGVYDATLVSAVALGEGERARLQAALEEYMRVRLNIVFHVDPRVVGGVRFQCGDLLVDDTVRGKLDRLRQKLERVVTL